MDTPSFDVILRMFGFALVSGLIGRYIAIKKKRRVEVFFLVGFLLGLFGLLILVFIPKKSNPLK